MSTPRRHLLAAAAALLAAPRLARAQNAAGTAQSRPIPIGVIGAGHIGGTLGALWVKAGHPVMFASRNPDQLKAMAQELGPLASTGTPEQAARFGQAVLVAIPFRALPQLGQDLAAELRGKTVLDANNATAARDGQELVQQVEQKGIGAVTAGFFPGAHVVRVFNSLNWQKLRDHAHRADPVAVPLAGDDQGAVQLAEQLVRDAGFAPVLVGGLDTAKQFQMGTPGYSATQEELSAATLRQRLGVR